jgi:iron complex outermembrane receptor protein
MKTPYTTVLFGWLILCGFVRTATAQTEPPLLSGTLRDERGGVLIAATVTAENLTTGVSKTVVSDERGYYEFYGLAAGDYSLQAVMPGFRSEIATVTIAANEPKTLDLTLQIAAISETVTVTRAEQSLSMVPKAVNVVEGEEIQFGQRRATPDETLRGIPGVYAQNRHDYSKTGGIRLNIRSPLPRGFSMQGVQLIQDGIPLTTADGTTQPTNINLGSTGRIEVIRGPSSVLYGNSAGGVVEFRTEMPSSRPLVITPDFQFGSYGYQRQAAKVEGTSGRLGYLVDISRLATDGYREHSAADVRQANIVLRTELDPSTELRGIFNLFDLPFGESSSTLTRVDAMNRPRSVRPQAIAEGWGEGATQGQGGVAVEHRFGSSQVIRASGWGMWRDVFNAIPFRVIELGRVGYGFRSEYGGGTRLGRFPFTWTMGFDASSQNDDRTEFVNEGVDDNGMAQEGSQLVDQLEKVFSLGPFIQASFEPRPRWTVTAGLRYDYFDFSVTDRFLSDGDQSGGRTMDAISPMIGVAYRATDELNLYGNFATAYQTPTTVELSNRPTGEGGFNPDLEPEDLRSFELGVRGLVPNASLRYDVAVYFAKLRNTLVQFEREDEQLFFRNAGESKRNGLEVLLDWIPTPSVKTRLAYTYQDFEFTHFVTDDGDFSGNPEPGAPPHRVFAELSYDVFGLRSVVNYEWIDAYSVVNDNSESNWASHVVNLRFALDRQWKRLDLRPFVGIDNLFDERYNSSTIPNSFGRRYYEPSPGREFFFGVTMSGGVD